MMKSNCILILNLFVFVILTFRNELLSTNGNHFPSRLPFGLVSALAVFQEIM